jgi:hypothetical protein
VYGCQSEKISLWGLSSPFISQREGSGYTERDRRDRAASPPPRVGPASPVDDDGGTLIPRPGAMYGVRLNGKGGTGLPGRKTRWAT